MTEITSRYPDGVPCWVDLGVPDYRRAMDFYRPLFGWEFDEGTEETGYYTMCLTGGKPAAAVAQPPGAGDRASWWTHYFAASDLDATIGRITKAGGSILMEPMDIMDAGRMTIAADPAGATFGLWQAGTMIGASIVNESGSVCWNELHTPQTEPAVKFYGSVFGYSTEPIPGGIDYAVLVLEGRENRPAGIYGTTDPPGPEGRPHWLTYFGVPNCDKATQQAVDGGGEVRSEPSDSSYGRYAIVADPFGAVLALVEPQ